MPEPERLGLIVTSKRERKLGVRKVWQLQVMICLNQVYFLVNSGEDPYRADAKKLTELTVEDLRHGFQVDANNELEGLEGRLSLLKSLGETILSKKEFFKVGTPGSLLDYILESVEGDKLEAEEILHCLLRSLGKIGPGRVTLGGQSWGCLDI